MALPPIAGRSPCRTAQPRATAVPGRARAVVGSRKCTCCPPCSWGPPDTAACKWSPATFVGLTAAGTGTHSQSRSRAAPARTPGTAHSQQPWQLQVEARAQGCQLGPLTGRTGRSARVGNGGGSAGPVLSAPQAALPGDPSGGLREGLLGCLGAQTVVREGDKGEPQEGPPHGPVQCGAGLWNGAPWALREGSVALCSCQQHKSRQSLLCPLSAGDTACR